MTVAHSTECRGCPARRFDLIPALGDSHKAAHCTMSHAANKMFEALEEITFHMVAAHTDFRTSTMHWGWVRTSFMSDKILTTTEIRSFTIVNASYLTMLHALFQQSNLLRTVAWFVAKPARQDSKHLSDVRTAFPTSLRVCFSVTPAISNSIPLAIIGQLPGKIKTRHM